MVKTTALILPYASCVWWWVKVGLVYFTCLMSGILLWCYVCITCNSGSKFSIKNKEMKAQTNQVRMMRYFHTILQFMANHLLVVLFIGIGTGGARGPGPPNILSLRLINIHTCSADRHDCSIYYVQPPKNGIASYAYGNIYTQMWLAFKFLT